MFVLLKEHLASEQLCQTPLLVFSGSRLDSAVASINVALRHQGVLPTIDAKRSATLRDLAAFLDGYPQFSRGAEYCRILCGDQPKVWSRPKELSFMAAGPSRVRMDRPFVQLAEPIPSAGMHRMAVTFKPRI